MNSIYLSLQKIRCFISKSQSNCPSSLRFAVLVSISLILSGITSNVQGQFTYAGLDLGVSQTLISEGQYGMDNTRINSVDLNFTAMFRPLQFLMIGGSLSLPVSQNSKFSFNGSPISDYNFGFNDFTTRYKPQQWDYTFERSAALQLKLRIIADNFFGLYAEGRLSFFSIQEEFTFKRAAVPARFFDSGNPWEPAIAELDLYSSKKHNVVAPGFAIGMLNHFAKFMYVDFAMGFDVVSLGPQPTFSYTIPYSSEYSDISHNYVTLSGKATQSHLALFATIGLGVYF